MFLRCVEIDKHQKLEINNFILTKTALFCSPKKFCKSPFPQVHHIWWNWNRFFSWILFVSQFFPVVTSKIKVKHTNLSKSSPSKCHLCFVRKPLWSYCTNSISQCLYNILIIVTVNLVFYVVVKVIVFYLQSFLFF